MCSRQEMRRFAMRAIEIIVAVILALIAFVVVKLIGMVIKVALIAWLASEECSFSTGAVFDISGGRATY